MKRLLRAAALAAALCFATPALAARSSYLPTVTVSVGTSATVLAAAGFSFVEVCNQDASKTLFWSWNDPAVTTATGRPLYPGACIQWVDVSTDQILRGVAVSGTLDARVTKGFGR